MDMIVGAIILCAGFLLGICGTLLFFKIADELNEEDEFEDGDFTDMEESEENE